jgi:hypothetical protein
METDTIIWLCLVAAYLILFALNLKAYFFLRTIHKIHQYTKIPKGTLSYLVPKFYFTINHVSKLRWVALIALFFYNWIAGVICLVVEFVLPIILPEEDDYKNITKMREELKRKNDVSLKFLDGILQEIMNKM